MTPRQALWLELMPFYIHEAWLLDERRFKEWLDLFTDDVLYFMPRRKNVLRREAHREVTPLGDLSLIEDDRRYLEMRVARLDTGMAWGEDPPSRTRHLIGNLVAEPLSKGEVKAKTAFLVYRSHLETDHQLLAGSREERDEFRLTPLRSSFWSPSPATISPTARSFPIPLPYWGRGQAEGELGLAQAIDSCVNNVLFSGWEDADAPTRKPGGA